MSEKVTEISSLAWMEYQRKNAKLRIYKDITNHRYYIEDEYGDKVELPKKLADEFARTMDSKKPEEWQD